MVTGAGLLAAGVIGFLTGVRGPHWPIYALILAGLAVLFLSPSPWQWQWQWQWQWLTLAPVPVSACGYAIGKEVAFLRLSRRQPVPPAGP
ncbi:hypothetical protein [Arthrobacter antioxidans]|uniref:hypothetical protein n=1 Tax=Arthrobacter antioxidans TaxID=2895818 RepID=UPI001FFE7866|nr:hypothetical protein [Arthrobacter antioxidans]